MRSRIIDDPQPGFFTLRLVKHGPPVPARIVHDDKGWSAIVCGEPDKRHTAEPFEHPAVARIWHSGRVIDELEYEFLLQTRQVAMHNWTIMRRSNPDAPAPHPLCQPDQPVRLATLPPVIPRRSS